jgi:hypothetical protein
MMRRRRLVLICGAFLLLAGVSTGGQEQPSQGISSSPYQLGDQTFSGSIGPYFPLFFMSFPLAIHPTNLTPGVVGSLQWQAYVTPDARIGIEAGGNVTFSPNMNALYVADLVAKFTYTIGMYPFELSFSMAAGLNWVKYQDQSTLDPLIKPSVSLNWIFDETLTFGLNVAYWWDMQFSQDPAKSRAGNGVEVSVGLLYHF